MNQITKYTTQTSTGFTLIELMVAVAIVGILAAIAYPSYQQHIIKSRRAGAQAEMMEIMNREQQYFFSKRSYAAIANGTELASKLGYTLPTDVSGYYSPSVTTSKILNASCAPVDSSIPAFVITMTASGIQLNDGNLMLDSAGIKCPDSKW